jgi:hypothetical protein
MNKALKIVTALPALLFIIVGFRWLLAPAGVAAEFGMPLLDGLGGSTQIGDIGAFFLGGGLNGVNRTGDRETRMALRRYVAGRRRCDLSHRRVAPARYALCGATSDNRGSIDGAVVVYRFASEAAMSGASFTAGTGLLLKIAHP